MIIEINSITKIIQIMKVGNMKIHSYKKHTHIYGFNGEKTFTIWTQGCSIRCKGCWNTFTWDPMRGTEIDIKTLIDYIKESEDTCVTILGGEPLDQKEECLDLIKQIKQLNKGIILYTGRELKNVDKEFLNSIDVLICGPYQEDKRILNNQMIGSSNQKIIFITSRYSEKMIQQGTFVEIDLNENTGEIDILGYPEDFLI